MKDYSKAAPTFWTGETGRQIRTSGRDVQVVAFYLFTCPSSNWIGLYYLPIPTLCHEVGISKEGALKALQRLGEIDFGYYDEERELAWVPGAAKFQVGESLKPKDNRILGIVKDLQKCSNKDFVQDFLRRYSGLYHLPEISLPDPPAKILRSPLQGPPKPVTEAVAVAVTEAVKSIAQSDEKQSLYAADADFGEAGSVTRSNAEPSLPEQPPAPPVFLKIPLIDKTEFPVTQRQVDEWKALYLAVDVEQEIRNYRGWALSNPKKRKTRRGILQSINSWLEDKQNKGGNPYGKSATNNAPAGTQGNYPRYVPKQRDLPEV